MPDGRTGKWVQTAWTKDELQGKTVEFKIWVGADKRPFHGVGHFDVVEVVDFELNPNLEKRLDIVMNCWFGTHGSTTRFFVPQEAVAAIQKNPPGSAYAFSLFLF